MLIFDMDRAARSSNQQQRARQWSRLHKLLRCSQTPQSNALGAFVERI